MAVAALLVLTVSQLNAALPHMNRAFDHLATWDPMQFGCFTPLCVPAPGTMSQAEIESSYKISRRIEGMQCCILYNHLRPSSRPFASLLQAR